LRRGVLLADEVLPGADEVVEHVLLLLEHPGAMPRLAELAAAAKVRERVDAPLLGPDDGARGELRERAGVESAVAGQVRRSAPVARRPLLVHDEHRHLRAVL